MKLKEILELEENQEYNAAYYAYQELLYENDKDFESWKHYFFFLWYMLDVVEGQFTVDINLKNTLVVELKKGQKLYDDIPEFNFIAGYAISIVPYEFGNCTKYEMKAIELLEKASSLESENPIYKMILLGAQWDFGGQENCYNEVCAKTKQIIFQTYNGKGLINKYFHTILNRYEEVLI